MRIKAFSILLFIVITLSSCWKDEEPIVLPSPGTAVQQQLTLGENYDKIIFFNVNDKQFLIRNLADWDLGFSCDENKRDIKINSGKDVFIYERSDTNFADPFTITPGLDWRYDVPSGNTDSTAVGKWWDSVTFESRRVVYIMDFGTNFSGTSRYKKFQVHKADKTGYWLRMGDLNGGNEINRFVPKDATRNYSYLNLSTGEAKTDMEPAKDSWDLVFTRYRHIFYDIPPDPIPYQVTGVLLNPNNVQAHEERNKKFEDIDLAYAMSVKLSKRADVVGYEWKSYNQGTGRYTVDITRTYIIKTISGYYYKFRFVDFYNDKGVKGAPTFEMQRL